MSEYPTWKPAAAINVDNPALHYLCVFELSDAEKAPLRVYGETDLQIRERAQRACRAVNNYEALCAALSWALDQVPDDLDLEHQAALEKAKETLNQATACLK